jgi:hypothetical protein
MLGSSGKIAGYGTMETVGFSAVNAAFEHLRFAQGLREWLETGEAARHELPIDGSLRSLTMTEYAAKC